MNNEGLDLVKPNAHDIIGYAIVGVSLEKVDQAMRRSIQVSFFITLAVIFMGILALILFNNRLIIYPLRKLLMGTQRIGEGDYNYRIDLNLSDELGMLATSFNQMTEKIKITQDQLAEYNRMLEEKVAERTKELSQALDKLTEADRIKSEFVTNLSHELRTPLNAVIGFSDIILQKIDGEINESQKKDLTLINNSGKHLLSLIDDLLDIAKIETGHAMVNYEQFQISTLAEQVISLTKQGLLDKDIKLKLEIAKDIPIIRADKFKIKRALLNLLSNAVKFTEKGHVALIVSYKEDKFIFEIQDTGIGIKEEDLNKIFERFRQLDSSTTRPHGGIGMGISLVTELIKMHKGDIWVNSVYGKGTSFFFTLPG
jgi:signal transduction histidine kinase